MPKMDIKLLTHMNELYDNNCLQCKYLSVGVRNRKRWHCSICPVQKELDKTTYKIELATAQDKLDAGKLKPSSKMTKASKDVVIRAKYKETRKNREVVYAYALEHMAMQVRESKFALLRLKRAGEL